MKRRIVLFFVAYVVWCLLSWPPDWQHLVIGAVVATLTAWLVGDLFVTRLYTLKDPRRYGIFLGVYLPYLAWACFKANFDVAYRILHPRLLIRPGIVKVKTTLKSDIALAFLANSITLTPGTMSVDLTPEKDALYVHCIWVQDEDVERNTERIVRPFENILKKVFE